MGRGQATLPVKQWIHELHECKDIDLAVWVSDSGCLRAMQKARSRAVNQLWQEYGIGVAHHQVDVFIMEPGSNRFLGRLCTYRLCGAFVGQDGSNENDLRKVHLIANYNS